MGFPMSIQLEKVKKVLAKVATELYKNNIDFVVIGSFVIPLLYNIPWSTYDIDLFITNRSTVVEYELFEKIAIENGWDIGTTPYGTPYYEIYYDGEVIRIDLLENIYDIYVPKKMIERAKEVNVEGVKIKVIRLEDQLVLKARAASEEDVSFLKTILEKLVKRNLVKVTIGSIEEAIQAFPETEQNSIRRRLALIGFYTILSERFE